MPDPRTEQSAIPNNVYVKNISFEYKLPPHPQAIPFTVTSVLGHVNSTDFGDGLRGWRSCDPFELFNAEIHETVGEVRPASPAAVLAGGPRAGEGAARQATRRAAGGRAADMRPSFAPPPRRI